MAFTIKTMKIILQRMQNRVVTRSDVTDLNQVSSVNQALAAAAREDDDQYFQMLNLLDLFDLDKAAGPDLDEVGKVVNPDILTRILAQAATGSYVFSRVGTVGVVTIVTGTQVEVPGTDIKFVTTEEATIGAGNQDSNTVSIVAEGTGTTFNVDPDTLTGFASKPPGVDSGTNPTAINNGVDLESDDKFRSRIKAYLKSLSRATNTAMIYAALTAIDSATGKSVIFAQSVEDEFNPGNVVLYIDDGAGTVESTAVGAPPDEVLLASALGGEVDFFTTNKPIKIESTFTLEHDPSGAPPAVNLVKDTDFTVDPSSGHIKLIQAQFPTGLAAGDKLTMKAYTYFDGLIQITQKIIDGDPTDRSTFPGYRAGGVIVRVLSPTIIFMTVAADITVLQDFSQTAVATAVTAAVSGYINGLTIGEAVILNELRKVAMSVPGMFDIKFTAPTQNRNILLSQLARIVSGNISIS